MTEPERSAESPAPKAEVDGVEPKKINKKSGPVREFGGPKGLEPTRYGDWEKNGRCIDF